MPELQPALPPPTQDERSMGMLVHILGIFTGFLAPLIIYIIKRESKFVSFHALQSLFWHLLYGVTVGVLMMVFFVVFIATIVGQAAQQHGASNAPPVGVFIVFPMFWIAMIVFGLVNLVLAIIFAIKANAGEWAPYPLVGGWARRAVGV